MHKMDSTCPRHVRTKEGAFGKECHAPPPPPPHKSWDCCPTSTLNSQQQKSYCILETEYELVSWFSEVKTLARKPVDLSLTPEPYIVVEGGS